MEDPQMTATQRLVDAQRSANVHEAEVLPTFSVSHHTLGVSLNSSASFKEQTGDI